MRENGRCEKRSTIRVFKLRPGRDVLVGRTMTDRSSGYTLPELDAHGRFYAVVARKEHHLDHIVNLVCERARSDTIKVR